MMTIQFQIRGMRDGDELRGRVAADLEALGRLMAVDSAQVALHHQPVATPSYQAVATLAVPGPDIHAAARDHTWPAAWQKVAARLREQIEERRSQPTARRKDPPHIHNPADRRAK